MDLFDPTQSRISFQDPQNNITTIAIMPIKEISKEEMSYMYLPGTAKPEHVPLNTNDICMSWNV